MKIRIILLGLSLSLITGCATTSRTSTFSDRLERPEATQTQFTNHLSCFGDMLADYRRAYSNGITSPLRIAIMDVKDATDVSTVTYPNSEIPSNFNDMTIGIASNIGGPLRILHIPNSFEIVDGLRLVQAEGPQPATKPFSAKHYRTNTLQIYGALTEYDRLTINRQRDIDGSAELGDGTGLTNIEASKFREKNSARMTMDFRAVQSSVGDIVNHASSTNTINLYQHGNDFSIGVSVDGQALGYAMSDSIVDARHKAIRLLIELGLMQVIGRYAKIPYWKCLPSFEQQDVVKVQDLLDTSQGTHLFAEIIELEAEEVAEDEGFQDEPQNTNTTPEDMVFDNRDKSLMMNIMSDFEYAQFVNVETRTYVARATEDFRLSSDKNVKALEGKQRKLKNILALYRKNNLEYAAIENDERLAIEIKSNLVHAGVLSEAVAISDKEAYLAFWANAPVQKGARWDLN